MKMKTFGPFFLGRIPVTDAPLVHLAPTGEIEHPFRFTSHSVVLRTAKDKAIVFGLWRKNEDFSGYLLTVLGGRVLEGDNRKAAFEAGNQDAEADGGNLE